MLRPSPNHGTQRLPNDDDEMMTLSRAAVIDISTKCWATKVIELGICTHANIHREASGIIIMLVIILIHILVPGEITNLNY